MSTPQVIVITAKYKKLDETPESGTIVFQMLGSLKSSADNEEITPGKFTGTLTSEGVLSLPVYATDDPDWSPVDRTYKVIVNLSAYRDTFDLHVPYDSPGATLDMADVGPAIPPSAGVMYALIGHTHPEYEGGGGGAVASVNGRTGAVTLTKSDVSLSSVDNTADSAKPVSTAQQTALDAKPNVYAWSGSAYVLVTTGDIYVGPTDPGTVGDGSIWIDTDA